jgi:serine/threonine protein kinase
MNLLLIVLGKGMVKLAVNKTTKQKVAVKLLRKDNINPEVFHLIFILICFQELERARREIDIMRQLTQLNNPYIIKLFESIETDSHLYIIEVYVSGGELVALILKNQGLPEALAQRIFKQILNAIECCHKNQIVHRDIKLSNSKL